MAARGFVLKHTSAWFEGPINTTYQVLAGAGLLSAAVVYGNSKLFVTPNSCTDEFKAEQAKIGNVIERTNAPAIYINPIMNKIPGNVLGPDDLSK